MSCTRVSITGSGKSELYNEIYEKLANQNEELADNLFNYFKSESFKEEFGDFQEDYKNNNYKSERIYDTGEPKLFYNETAKKHYYINKDKEQVYFPLVDRGLRALYSYDQINKIKSRLALTYFSKSKLDFNNINFDEAKALPNISTFIQNELLAKIEDLNKGSLRDKLQARGLTKTLNHVDELSTGVENFFKELSLTIKEDEENGEWLQEEDGKDPVFNQHSAERNTKDSISTNIKIRLSLLKDTENIDPIWNEPTFLSRDVVYSSLQGVLTDIVPMEGEDVFELHKIALARVVDKKPYLKQLLDYLNADDISDYQKSEFSQAFNLIKNNHIVSQYTNKDGVVSHSTVQISDTGSKTTQIKDKWDDAFKIKFLSGTNRLKDSAKPMVTSLIPVIKDIKNRAEGLKKTLVNETSKEQEAKISDITNELIDYLSNLGVEVTEEGFDNFIDNYGKDISVKDMFDNLLTLIEQSEYVTNGIFNKYENTSDKYSSFTELSQSFSKLAMSESFFLSEGSDATIVTGGSKGKTVQKWIYSYPTYISTKVKQWKRKPELLLELYKSGNYQLGSHYMGVLTGSIDNNGNKKEYNSLKEQLDFSRRLLDKIDVGMMNQMSAEKNFKTTTELSYKDYLVDYVNKVIKGDDFIRTTTQADKTTELQIKTNIKVSSYGGIKDGKLVLTKAAKNVMFGYFASEINRMIEANQEVEDAILNPSIKLTPHYHYDYKNNNIHSKDGNAFKSQYFDNLSIDAKNKSKLERDISDILYKDGNIIVNKVERGLNEQLDSLFDEYLESKMHVEFSRTMNYLQSTELLIRNNEGNIVPNKIDSKIISKEYSKISPNQHAYAISADFLINSIVNNIEFSKMFSGDVAYYKNMTDYKKRVPATYTDGLQLRITKGNEHFRIATISSVMRKSPFYDKLVESLGEEGAKPYNSINSADAQAWITPQRWKFLLQSLGKWSKAHDKVYSNMMSDTPSEYTKEELKLAAQPLKGVFFERDSTGKPTYLKYSQAVLSKDLIKGSDLEKVYNKMISNKVDELITFDGVKVGSIQPTTIHDENGNVMEDFTLNVQTLSNRGWKLQQDLPTKTYKDTDVGSQIQKNIFAGLLHNQELNDFELDGELKTGKEIKDEIVKTVTGLTNEGLKSLKNEFGIGEDYKIGNMSGFYKALVRELEQRGGSENVVKALEAETTIVGIPQSGGKLFNIFASVMNSRLIKIKTNGGSFIQMSNFGLNKTEAEGKGVIWSPLADETTNEPYIYVHPDTLRPTVKPGGVLVSGSFIAKYIPNWSQYTAEELFVGKDGKPPIISKEIQENIIGYRIPNQGLASNDALRIVGILPESAGDTIVAYTGITTKTGSDFDVDKMYIMFPSYKEIDGHLVYNKYDSENITKEGLQNRLIELYKSVLTHPKVYKEVMKPIDIDFIENELNALFPEKSNIFMNHFDPETDTKLRYSFLGGKAGVGQEANAMVDISREGVLSLNNVKDILWGHHNKDGESKFDEEYSEELSDEDLSYYVDKMIKKGTSDIQIEEFKNTIRKVKVGDSLTAILNAFVDIAKDPYISKGNWTMSTTNVGNLLLRAGAHPLYVINFLANPIIKQYIDFQKSKESLTDVTSGDMFEKFKKQIVIDKLNRPSLNEGLPVTLGNIYNDYFKDLDIDYKKDSLLQKLDDKLITKDEYDIELNKINDSFNKIYKTIQSKLKVDDEKLDNIIKFMKEDHNIAFNPNKLNIFDRNSNQWDKYKLDLKYFRNQNTIKNIDLNFQINLLNTFKVIQEYSKNLRENVLVSKSDTTGMGKDHNALFGMFNMYDQILQRVANDEKGAIKGFETKFQGTTLEAYWNSLKWVKNVVESNSLLFPTATKEVRDIFDEISNDIYGTKITNEDLLTDLGKDFNSYLLSKFFDISKDESKDLINNLPSRVKEFKDKNEGKYFILEELNINIASNPDFQSTVQLNNRKKSKSYDTLFTNSWKDLFIDNPSLAEDLVKYSFATTGFQMSTSQFFTYIPSEYFIQNDINNNVVNTINKDNYDFLDQFYLNNLDNKKYVKNVFKDNLNSVDFNKGFTTKDTGKFNYYVQLTVDTTVPVGDTGLTIPSTAINNYKLIGYNKEEQGVYKLVKPIVNTLNNKKLVTYTDYVETSNRELESQVMYDRQMVKLDNVIQTETKQEVEQVVESEQLSLFDNVQETNSETIEDFYNEFKDKLGNTTLEDLKLIELLQGTEYTIEYIKKCKG